MYKDCIVAKPLLGCWIGRHLTSQKKKNCIEEHALVVERCAACAKSQEQRNSSAAVLGLVQQRKRQARVFPEQALGIVAVNKSVTSRPYDALCTTEHNVPDPLTFLHFCYSQSTPVWYKNFHRVMTAKNLAQAACAQSLKKNTLKAAKV